MFYDSSIENIVGKIVGKDEQGNPVDEDGRIRPAPKATMKKPSYLKKALIGAIVVASAYGALTGVASYSANKKLKPALTSLSKEFEKRVEIEPFTFDQETRTLNYDGQLKKITNKRDALLRENNVSLIGLDTGWNAYSLDGITPEASIGSTTVFDPNPMHGVDIIKEVAKKYITNSKK